MKIHAMKIQPKSKQEKNPKNAGIIVSFNHLTLLSVISIGLYFLTYFVK